MRHSGKNLVITAALLGAGFFLGYLRFRPHLGLEMAYTDGEQTYEDALGPEIRYAVWDEPEPLSDEVNTDEAEGRAAISPDGRWLVFTAGEAGLNQDLFVAELHDGAPVDPRPLAEVNSPFDDTAPAFSSDALYFASDRTGGAGGLDLWRAPYADGELGPPVRLPDAINSEADDTDPAPVPGSMAVAFATNRPDRRSPVHDLYMARPFPDPEASDGVGWRVAELAALSSAFDDREPVFAADGRHLFFASNRTDELDPFAPPPGYDLYRSVLQLGTWLPPAPLAGLNTVEASERAPAPSADGFTMVFGVQTAEDEGDLWRARSQELLPIPGRPIGWMDLLILSTLLLLALLAFLAKRWEQLEIIYKCALLSVIVHLLLLWWFTRVRPDGEEVQLPEREAMFQVRVVAGSAREAASRQERGGELAAEPARSETAAAPAWTERPAEERAALAAAPAAAVERSAARAVEGPERLERDFERERALAAAAPAAVALERVPESVELRRGDAPAFVHEASSESAARPARAESVDPGERESAPSAAAAFVRQAAPAPAAAARGARREDPSETAAEVGAALRDPELLRTAGTAASQPVAVSLAAPRETAARRSETAPELELAAPTPGRSFERSDASPERAAEAVAASAAETPTQVLPQAVGEGLERGAARAPEVEPLRASAAGADPTALERAQPTAHDVALADAEPARPRAESADGDPGSSPVDADEDWLSAPVTTLERREGGELELTPARFEGRASESTRTRDRESDVPRPTFAGLETEPAPGEALVEAGASAPVRANEDLVPRALDRRDVELEGPVHEPSERVAQSDGATASSADTASGLEDPLLDLASTPSPRPSRDEDELAPRRHEPREAGRGSEPERPGFAPVAALDRADAGGTGDAPDAGRMAHTPYRSRFGAERERALELHGGGVETELAVASGLAYLARIQSQMGHWGSEDDYDDKYGHVSVGKTGLAMLAFLGAGHTPRSNTEHSAVVRRAIDFLLAVQESDSGHFGYTSSYSHGIATYALAECFALTKDERLRGPLERAVAHILERQLQTGNARTTGGWGYYYPDDRVYDRWPRVSVTAWQVMALESGRLAGLTVPDRTFARAKRYLLRSWDGDRGFFRYSHDPERLRSAYATLPGSTPAALFVLSLLGEDVAGEDYADARRFVQRRRPNGYRYTSDDDFIQRANGNLYFWYYGSLAMFRVGGRDWESWNERMKATLLPSQQEDGSWRPISIYARQYAGDDGRDRSYSTAMAVLSLEVYYRYFTPLLKVE